MLAYARGDEFACVVNMSGAAIALPDHQTCLLASGPLDGDLLPPDTAVWLRLLPCTGTGSSFAVDSGGLAT